MPCSKQLKHYVCAIIFIIAFCLTGSARVFAAEEGEKLVPVRGVLHLNTDVSSGEYPPEHIVRMAQEADMDAVFLTENLKPKWEYGLLICRSIAKKTVEKDGLLKYGAEKYSDRIDSLDERARDLTVLMAAEVAPFYYWTGTPFRKGSLTLNNWDVQFLVMGMDAKDYKNIPTVSTGGFARDRGINILMLWPFILMIAGVISLKWKHTRFFLPNSFCWAMIIIGVLFALRNYPFKAVKYDQYHADVGTGPYQAVIDYVNKKGGVTFWSNPEAKTHMKVDPIVFISPSAEKHMLETKDYTGFCCFYEGYRNIGGPGGIWDAVLEDYCHGLRKSPVWTIGEMAYHGKEAPIGKPIGDVQTVFLVPSNTRENILKAMKEGSMYAVRRSVKHELELDSFMVEYPEDNKKAGMGQELTAGGPVTVRFKVDWSGKPGEIVIAKLIRNGIIVREFFITKPGEFEFKDDFYRPGEKVYYRLDIRGKYPSMLFSNPIFVEFK
ncbi:MAG: hypothetical protein WBC99_06630 [Candidatus Omnitrophota bacterium]